MTRHDATNDATERDNVTFEEAARLLGVSLRTVQRRVKDGNLNSIERDGARLVCLAPAATTDATRDTTERDNDAIPRQIDATKRDTAQAGSTPALAASLAQSREEILFLRGLVEQHQRSEAELRAALRKALDAMPLAITAGNESAPIEAATAPENTQANQTTQPAKQSAPRGTQRKTLTAWQRIGARILGIR
jgi:excisionase family DNA binding protein